MRLTNEICISFLQSSDSGWLYNHDKEITISERNKAIDDCKEICNKNWLNGTVAYRIIEELCEQMEQLKAGGKND